MTSSTSNGGSNLPPPDQDEPDWDGDGDELPDFLNVANNVADATAPGTSSAASSPVGGNYANTTESISQAGSGLVFVNTYGANVTATFRNEIVAAENYLQTHFTNSATINASFDLQSLSPSFAGENSFTYVTVSYAQLVGALASHATSADDRAAVAALQALPDPSGGQAFAVPLGEANVLGLYGAYSGTYDNVILNSRYFTATALQNYPNDVVAVLEHELTEGGMGRIGGLWGPMDLFRYTATGQRDFTGGQDGKPTYFSTNGVSVDTGLQFHNPINSLGQDDGEDWADWDQVGADANAHDPFGPGGPGAGDPGVLSPTDLRIMDVLGWTGAPSGGTRSTSVYSDLTGDGVSDVLMWDSSTSSAGYWSVAGGNTFHSLGSPPGAYTIVGRGDLNGDLAQDIVWRNSATGAWGWSDVANGNTWHALGTSGAGYAVAGVADFNSDGFGDVLWANVSTGDWGWSDVHNRTAWHDLGTLPAGYTAVSVGDVNHDGVADAILRNNTTGAWGWTDISANTFHNLGASTPSYHVLGTGDFNGDGFADVLWSDPTSGDAGWTDINNRGQWHDLGVVSGYTAVGLGDFNADGYTDVVWQSAANGATQWSDPHNGNAFHQVVASTTSRVV
jgi:hypothetical protein